jgi:hypothetical protein
MRDQKLREKSSHWWENARREGEWVRGDERVSTMADKLGVGTWEEGEQRGVAREAENPSTGKLRANARTFVQAMWRLVQPSPVATSGPPPMAS